MLAFQDDRDGQRDGAGPPGRRRARAHGTARSPRRGPGRHHGRSRASAGAWSALPVSVCHQGGYSVPTSMIASAARLNRGIRGNMGGGMGQRDGFVQAARQVSLGPDEIGRRGRHGFAVWSRLVHVCLGHRGKAHQQRRVGRDHRRPPRPGLWQGPPSRRRDSVSQMGKGRRRIIGSPQGPVGGPARPPASRSEGAQPALDLAEVRPVEVVGP